MAKKKKPRITFSPRGVATNVSAGDNVNVSASAGPGGVRVTPTVRFSNSAGSQQGAAVGGMAGQLAGTAIAGPVGGAVGSAVGSAYGSLAGDAYKGGSNTAGALAGVALGDPTGGAIGSAIGGAFGGKSQGAKETDQRKAIINNYAAGGFFDSKGSLELADGTIFNAFKDSQADQHDWKYQDKRVDNQGDRKLFNYEIDYTNDLDYLSGMAGVSLSRVLSGGTNKSIDQVGGLLGNAFLGKTGHGAEFNEQTFENVITNARSAYAKKGIDSKEEFLALANKMFSEGRIKDADYAVMNQTASMVFDKDFNTATKLMSGRNKGIQVAGQSPSDSNATMTQQNQPGRVFSPVISPEEAMLSVSPYLAAYKAARGKNPKGASNTASDLAQATGLISAVAGSYKAADKATGGAIGDYISSGIGAIRDYITGVPGEAIGDLEEAAIGDLMPDLGDIASSATDILGSIG